MRSLLFPFKWWHIFITIVPLNLLEVIEAPVPIMIGILREEFETLDFQTIENRIWILLDKDQLILGNLILSEGEKIIYEPHLNGLRAKLETIYEEIKLIGGKVGS